MHLQAISAVDQMVRPSGRTKLMPATTLPEPAIKQMIEGPGGSGGPQHTTQNSATANQLLTSLVVPSGRDPTHKTRWLLDLRS